MENKSKLCRVKERIELATVMLAFVVEAKEAFPVLIELFNMAFNYPKSFSKCNCYYDIRLQLAKSL